MARNDKSVLVLARLSAQILLLIVSLIGLVLCPYSKVEESFSLQAVHDLFYHGLPPIRYPFHNKNEFLPYDHLKYPGVVPRTFICPLILTAACQVVRLILLPLLDIADHPMLVQFIARAALLILQLQAWYRMAHSLDKHFHGGHGAAAQPPPHSLGTYLLLLTAVQFHLPYYSSRFLANSFATVLTLHVYSDWLVGRVDRAASTLVVAMTLLRCDLLLLLATCGLVWIGTRQLTIVRAISIGLKSMGATLLLSVPLDSWIWQRWVWPEGVVFFENVVGNMSVNYGTNPWHWYVTSALPKAMLLTILLLPLSVVRIERLGRWGRLVVKRQTGNTGPSLRSCFDTQWLIYILPAIGYVALYSFLGHKEARFLFPVLPLFNLAAAVGCQRVHGLVWPDKDKHVSKYVLASFVLVMSILLVSFMASLTFLGVSSWNYPGGHALARLSNLVKHNNQSVVNVHIDVAAAMTGVSLFGQRAAKTHASNAKWTFQKAGYENEHANVADYRQFSYLLSEQPAIEGFQVMDTIQGNPRLDLRRLTIATSDAIHIHGRANGLG